MQAGGHRFDPGQLHQETPPSNQEAIMESITSLGPFLIPITAILVSGVIAIIVLILRHQERIAKIERGIDPDAPRR